MEWGEKPTGPLGPPYPTGPGAGGEAGSTQAVLYSLPLTRGSCPPQAPLPEPHKAPSAPGFTQAGVGTGLSGEVGGDRQEDGAAACTPLDSELLGPRQPQAGRGRFERTPLGMQIPPAGTRAREEQGRTGRREPSRFPSEKVACLFTRSASGVGVLPGPCKAARQCRHQGRTGKKAAVCALPGTGRRASLGNGHHTSGLTWGLSTGPRHQVLVAGRPASSCCLGTWTRDTHAQGVLGSHEWPKPRMGKGGPGPQHRHGPACPFAGPSPQGSRQKWTCFS